jgi:glucose dehydrogenase
MSVDHQRGWVFVATGSPTFDFWGGDRNGSNLFANCVICLDARTGKRIWHYQTVHHDLFDYDLPCAPNLVTVMHNGAPRDAVAQVGKTGWVYLLDRETGEPLYPIEERPVAASTVPGEEAWPTQPFVTNPPAFSRQYFGPEDVAHLSDDSYDYLLNQRLEGVALSPKFTPPALAREVVVFPGYHGGGLWGGASWRADKGILFVNHNEIPWASNSCVPPKAPLIPLNTPAICGLKTKRITLPSSLPGDACRPSISTLRRFSGRLRSANTTNSQPKVCPPPAPTTAAATLRRKAGCSSLPPRWTAPSALSAKRTAQYSGSTP